MYHELGMTAREIGEKFGISTQAANSRLRHAGIPRRKAGFQSSRRYMHERPVADEKAVIAKYVEVGNIQEVRKHFRLQYDAVKKVLKAAGFPIGGSLAPVTRQLRVMEVGETRDFPRPKAAYAGFYHAARAVGVKVSCSVKGDVVSVTRVE